MADDSAMGAQQSERPDEEDVYLAHKLLTSSVAVYPPLPLSSSFDAVPLSPHQIGHVSQILLSRGRWLEVMGHRSAVGGGRVLLHVEEMVWALEQGMIEVMHEGVPLSVEEAYTLLHDTTVPHALAHPATAYATYTCLRNSGYVLMRPREFGKVHKVAASSASAAAAAAASAAAGASTAAAAVAPYSVTSYPAPQAKKQMRRDSGMPLAAESQEKLQQERARLRAMQSWLPTMDAAAESEHTIAAASTVVASVPSSSASSPALSTSLTALLSLPCDLHCVWLPSGGGGASGGGKESSFRKSSPGLPDFLCLCTNPWLTWEKLWEGRLRCTPEAVNLFQRQRRMHWRGAPDSSSSSSAASTTPCLADALQCMYDLSAERPSAFPVPLRIAYQPLHQQRVFFIDWPLMEPPPSCIDPPSAQAYDTPHAQAQHAQVFKLASAMSIFA